VGGLPTNMMADKAPRMIALGTTAATPTHGRFVWSRTRGCELQGWSAIAGLGGLAALGGVERLLLPIE
jgi:hypothetical protein